MKARFVILVFLVVLALSFSGGGSLAQDAAPQESAEDVEIQALHLNERWFRSTLDQEGDRGSFTSTAIFPGTNRAWIAYYDATAGDLRVARFVGKDASNGNCGPDNAWVCETVPDPDRGTNDLGRHASIAIYKSSGVILSSWKVGIAYQDSTAHSLKMAEYRCTLIPLPGSCSWSFSTVRSVSLISQTGNYASLQYDQNGTAHIAFQTSSFASEESLVYAHQVSEGGSCGVGAAEGKWQCDTIETGEGMGRYVSLDLSITDIPYMAYYDGSLKDLKYAWQLDGGSCGPGGNTWTCITIDGAEDVGLYPSLALPKKAGEIARIAYYDASNENLKLAYIDNDNSNCGGVYPWRCITIDAMGTDPGVRSIAMAAHENVPMIAYRVKPTDGLETSILKTVSPKLLGNCGPLTSGPLMVRTWQCTTLDTGMRMTGMPLPITFHDVGKHPSIVLTSAGLPMIAYYDDTSDDLLIAYQYLHIYAPIAMRAP
jgi:hypothetical protein